MAFGANLDLDLSGSGAGHKFVTAGAGYFNLLIFRMDTFFHPFHLFLLFLAYCGAGVSFRTTLKTNALQAERWLLNSL